jgi:hypothetical protein
MNRSIVIAASGFGCLLALPAHAYVDPGTGSMAIQMLIGGVVAAAFVIKTYYYELRRRIARLFGRDTHYKPGESSAGADPQVSEESSKSSK